MSQLVEELVKSGQRHNLMSTNMLMWESTTTAGIQVQIFMGASGATPLIQRSGWKSALSRFVMQHMTVRKAIPWVSHIWESGIPLPLEGHARSGQKPHIAWESTTSAGILLAILKESGASQMIQIGGGSTALFQYVLQC